MLSAGIFLICFQWLVFGFKTPNASDTVSVLEIIYFAHFSLILLWIGITLFLIVRPHGRGLWFLLGSLVLKCMGDALDLTWPNWQVIALLFAAIALSLLPLIKLKKLSLFLLLASVGLNVLSVSVGILSCEYQAGLCRWRSPSLAESCESTRFHLDCNGNRVGWAARGLLALRCMDPGILTLQQTKEPISCYGG